MSDTITPTPNVSSASEALLPPVEATLQSPTLVPDSAVPTFSTDPVSPELQSLAQQNAAVNKYNDDVMKARIALEKKEKAHAAQTAKQSTEVVQSSVASALPDPRVTAANLTKGPGGATMVSQRQLYSKVAAKHQQILDALYSGLTSKNEMTRLSAAKILLNKILPDLKAVEVGGEVNPDGTRQAIQLFVDTGRGFVPATVTTSATSARGHAEQSGTLQDTNLAQTSTENNDSNIRDSEAGSA